MLAVALPWPHPPFRLFVRAQVLQWVAARTPEEIIELREHVMSQIEEAGARLWRSKGVNRWMGGAETGVQRVSRSVNGSLFEQLLAQLDCGDVAAARLFMNGALQGVCVRV